MDVCEMRLLLVCGTSVRLFVNEVVGWRRTLCRVVVVVEEVGFQMKLMRRRHAENGGAWKVSGELSNSGVVLLRLCSQADCVVVVRKSTWSDCTEMPAMCC